MRACVYSDGKIGEEGGNFKDDFSNRQISLCKERFAETLNSPTQTNTRNLLGKHPLLTVVLVCVGGPNWLNRCLEKPFLTSISGYSPDHILVNSTIHSLLFIFKTEISKHKIAS